MFLSGKVSVTEKELTFVIPSVADRVAIFSPIGRAERIRRLPVIPKQAFHFIIPLRMLAAVIRIGAVTKPVGRLRFGIIRLMSRRNHLGPSGLFDRVRHPLLRVGLFAAEIMLRLIPVTLERGLGAIPG